MKTINNARNGKLALPPQAVTRARLGSAAQTLQGMRKATAQPVVIVADTAGREAADKLRAELAAMRAENAALKTAQAERAQRWERVKAITLRVVDNRAAWAAKVGGRQAPRVTVTSQRITTTDVWQAGQEADD